MISQETNDEEDPEYQDEGYEVTISLNDLDDFDKDMMEIENVQ